MRTRSGISAAAILALALGLAGCATYKYTAQQDSASVRWQTPGARVTKIDGLSIGMSRSADSAVFVSPGAHEIVVDNSSSFSGDEDGWATQGITVKAEFAANHRYQFTVSSDGTGIVLWDETTGFENRTKVEEWNIDSDAYSVVDNVPIEPIDLGGVHFARPPLDRGEKPPHPGGPDGSDKHGPPPHSGGPPSIPHNPPPSHGGGGGSGGGHSGGGGGGGGGHSGGGGGGGGDHKK